MSCAKDHWWDIALAVAAAFEAADDAEPSKPRLVAVDQLPHQRLVRLKVCQSIAIKMLHEVLPELPMDMPNLVRLVNSWLS